MIFKTTLDASYTQISNNLINDPDLTWQAKGILIYLLSKPPSWEVSITDIVNHAQNGEKSVRKHINLLINHGYIVRHQERNSGIYSRTHYDVHSIKQEMNTQIKQRCTPYAQKRHAENRLLSNTDYSTTKNISKEKTNMTKSEYSSYISQFHFDITHGKFVHLDMMEKRFNGRYGSNCWQREIPHMEAYYSKHPEKIGKCKRWDIRIQRWLDGKFPPITKNKKQITAHSTMQDIKAKSSTDIFSEDNVVADFWARQPLREKAKQQGRYIEVEQIQVKSSVPLQEKLF